MDKKTAGFVGAISALPLAASAPAAEARTLDEVMSPRSYAELLQPIPNAAALLKDAMAKKESSQSEPLVQTAQYYGGPYYGGPYYGGYYGGYGYPYRRRWHHHHHHHHGWGWGYGGYGGYGDYGYYGRRRYHHHHHWHDDD